MVVLEVMDGLIGVFNRWRPLVSQLQPVSNTDECLEDVFERERGKMRAGRLDKRQL